MWHKFYLMSLILVLYRICGGKRISVTTRKGPLFIHEPPKRVEFLNTTGTVIPCSAYGNPSTIVKWVTEDGTSVTDIRGLRHIRLDGTLVFHPFRAEEYRQDIHAVVYRCTASNNVGTIVSRDVQVRADIMRTRICIFTYGCLMCPSGGKMKFQAFRIYSLNRHNAVKVSLFH